MAHLIRSAVMLVLLTTMAGPLKANDADVLIFSFNGSSNIIFTEPSGTEPYIIASLYAEDRALTLNNVWPIKKIDSDTYAIRYIDWSQFYWIIKKSTRQVYEVSSGRFGEATTGRPVPDIDVRCDERYNTVSLWFNRARLEVDVRRTLVRYVINDIVILEPEEWQIEKVKYGVLHVRRTFWSRSIIDWYWEVDVPSNKLFIVKGEKFDEPAKNRQALRDGS